MQANLLPRCNTQDVHSNTTLMITAQDWEEMSFFATNAGKFIILLPSGANYAKQFKQGFLFLDQVSLSGEWLGFFDEVLRCTMQNIRGLIWNSQHRPGALWLLKSSWQRWNTEICLRAQTTSSIIKIVLTKYTNVHIITRTFVSHHIMFTRSELNNFLCQGRSVSIEPPFVCLWKSSTNNSRRKIVFNDILKLSQWLIMIWSIWWCTKFHRHVALPKTSSCVSLCSVFCLIASPIVHESAENLGDRELNTTSCSITDQRYCQLLRSAVCERHVL